MSGSGLWVWTMSALRRRKAQARRGTRVASVPGPLATRTTSAPALRNSSASGPSGAGASDTAITL